MSKGLTHTQQRWKNLVNNDLLLRRFSHVQLFATLWTVARQASLSMGFFRQEYWSGLLCLLPNPEIESTSLTSPVLAGGFFTTSTTWEAPLPHTIY